MSIAVIRTGTHPRRCPQRSDGPVDERQSLQDLQFGRGNAGKEWECRGQGWNRSAGAQASSPANCLLVVLLVHHVGEVACAPSTMTNGQARLPELTLKRSGVYSRSTLTCPFLSSGERWAKLARRYLNGLSCPGTPLITAKDLRRGELWLLRRWSLVKLRSSCRELCLLFGRKNRADLRHSPGV